MMRFVEKANLPQGKVKSVICGELCDELNEYFDSVGVQRILISPNENIDKAVKYHTDMAAIHLGGNKVIIDKNQNNLTEIISNMGVKVYSTAKAIAGEYPYDIALNFTLSGHNIIGKLDYADEVLLDCSDIFNFINVKQGYCKCSCLVVEENAIITDDESIYKTLINNGFDVLLISKGDVRLEGHEYGFIGGASGKISKNEILFFGDVTEHRDYKLIVDFIKKYGCEIISLDFPLTDFGGIIPLAEEF